MSFKVNAADIEGFAKLIGRASEDMHESLSYIDNEANEDGFDVQQGLVGELWQGAYGNHTARVQEVKSFLRKVRELLDASGEELKRSAKHYQATDQEQAAKIDSTYPGSKRGKPDDDLPSVNGGDFRDANDARSKLKPLEADPAAFDFAGKAQDWAQGHAEEFQFNAPLKVMGAGLDVFSPSALVMEGCKLLLGVDPFGEIAALIGGDWEGYMKCAGLWGNLAEFCRLVAANINHGNASISVTWTGNAADAACVYFEEIANLLDSAAESFESLKKNYESVASTAFGVSETAKWGLGFIGDWAIEAFIAWAAGTAAAETGVGLVGTAAAYAVVAKRAIDALKMYEHIIKAIDGAVSFVKLGYIEMGRETTAMQAKVKKFPVPGKSYDNAVV
ncbi:WXG100 family type VII secretion target [Streptomyces sioyaensis]|uniref:WXG100 family type VII secretion target n=1 Tax=Streptomyces sioyaensis TaxID=67364 RepID=UPI0037D1E928